MTVARHYVMTAAKGQETALAAGLKKLADVVRGLPGSEGVDLLADCGDNRRFLFIEKWTSIEAHKASGSLLPKSTLSPVTACLAAPPESAYLDYLTAV